MAKQIKLHREPDALAHTAHNCAAYARFEHALDLVSQLRKSEIREVRRFLAGAKRDFIYGPEYDLRNYIDHFIDHCFLCEQSPLQRAASICSYFLSGQQLLCAPSLVSMIKLRLRHRAKEATR